MEDGFYIPILEVLEGTTDIDEYRSRNHSCTFKNNKLYRVVFRENVRHLLLVVPLELRKLILKSNSDDAGHFSISKLSVESIQSIMGLNQ